MYVKKEFQLERFGREKSPVLFVFFFLLGSRRINLKNKFKNNNKMF